MSQAFTGPAVHLIDGENLLATPAPAPAAVALLWQVYRSGTPATPRDQFRMGGSGLFASRAALVLPHQGVRLLVRDGRDGGDLALIESVDLDHLERRYARLVIASGDGGFAPLARAARGRGLHVHVVTGSSPCALALERVATTMSHLHPQRHGGAVAGIRRHRHAA